MIKTVYDIKDFTAMVDFGQDIFYTWETENVSKKDFPVVEMRKKIFGLSGSGDLIIYDSNNRISMLALMAANPDVLDPHILLSEAVKDLICDFEEVVESIAKDHECVAIPGSLALSLPTTDNSSSMAIISALERRLEALGRRLDAYENNDANVAERIDERLDALELRLRRLEAGENYDD